MSDTRLLQCFANFVDLDMIPRTHHRTSAVVVCLSALLLSLGCESNSTNGGSTPTGAAAVDSTPGTRLSELPSTDGVVAGPGQHVDERNHGDVANLDQRDESTDSAAASDPLKSAPAELRRIVDRFHVNVEFREAVIYGDRGLGGGYHWRMPLSDDVLAAHIEEFKLEPASPGLRTEKLLRYFPADWPDISDSSLEWFAWPYNRDDSDRLQLWSVMAIDREASVLYFFWQNYDVTG